MKTKLTKVMSSTPSSASAPVPSPSIVNDLRALHEIIDAVMGRLVILEDKTAPFRKSPLQELTTPEVPLIAGRSAVADTLHGECVSLEYIRDRLDNLTASIDN